jgi:hypothetical protein
MANVIMVNAIMANVIMLNFIMANVIGVNVRAAKNLRLSRGSSVFVSVKPLSSSGFTGSWVREFWGFF